jgi:NAD+ diphosphatase
MLFTPSYTQPVEMTPDDLWFLFNDGKLLIKNLEGDCAITTAKDIEVLGVQSRHRQYLGVLNHIHCYTAEASNHRPLPEPFAFHDIRSLFNRMDEAMILAAGTANQLVLWDQNHRHCGKCGSPTQTLTDERAKTCPKCGLTNYPRLSPAIIVAIVRDNRILLANSKRFPGKMYSVLAGFVEPGESIEDCVEREVKEEVGIAVKNIRYFGSQPWPFPDSLMIGYTAEWAHGEIEVDEAEICDADWFSADNLPSIPTKISIAGKLIDWFVNP